MAAPFGVCVCVRKTLFGPSNEIKAAQALMELKRLATFTTCAPSQMNIGAFCNANKSDFRPVISFSLRS